MEEQVEICQKCGHEICSKCGWCHETIDMGPDDNGYPDEFACCSGECTPALPVRPLIAVGRVAQTGYICRHSANHNAACDPFSFLRSRVFTKQSYARSTSHNGLSRADLRLGRCSRGWLQDPRARR